MLDGGGKVNIIMWGDEDGWMLGSLMGEQGNHSSLKARERREAGT